MNYKVSDLIGNTPMYKLKEIPIYLKLEAFNPTGSIKDRAAKQIVEDAIAEEKLKKGMSIVEATSGNMGISLAAIGKALGYGITLIMPESMSEERKSLLKGYGANLILTPKEKGMVGAIEHLNYLMETNKNSYFPKQFENQSNIKAHYLTTAPEIWRDMKEEVDALVSGIGTGGTIMGISKYLKEKNKNCYIVGVEPEGSPFITKGCAGAHKIQGIGAGFFPPLLDLNSIDEIMTISDEEAYKTVEDVAIEDGLFLGPSSGAAIAAAKKLLERTEFQNKKIAVICPDNIFKYISLLK